MSREEEPNRGEVSELGRNKLQVILCPQPKSEAAGAQGERCAGAPARGQSRAENACV